MMDQDIALFHRLTDRVTIGQNFKTVLETPETIAWFESYERGLIEAFLALPASANDDRYAIQVAIKTVRALKGWMSSQVAAGAVAAKSLETRKD